MDDQFLKDLQEQLDIKITAYSEKVYSEKKKAYALKSSWSARITPFALLSDDSVPIKAFYSEAGECTPNNIITFVTKYERSRSS